MYIAHLILFSLPELLTFNSRGNHSHFPPIQTFWIEQAFAEHLAPSRHRGQCPHMPHWCHPYCSPRQQTSIPQCISEQRCAEWLRIRQLTISEEAKLRFLSHVHTRVSCLLADAISLSWFYKLHAHILLFKNKFYQYTAVIPHALNTGAATPGL